MTSPIRKRKLTLVEEPREARSESYQNYEVTEESIERRLGWKPQENLDMRPLPRCKDGSLDMRFKVNRTLKTF